MSNARDRLAKCILEETLESIGLPRREFEIDPGYLPRADCCVLPVALPPEAEWPGSLRLLYRMAQVLCLFEVETHPPGVDQVLDLHCKQMNLRNRRRQQAPSEESVLPWLWIVTCGRPVGAFSALEIKAAAGWPTGVYQAAQWTRIGVVVVPELPRLRETLLLRLMGPAALRDEALAEIRQLGDEAPERNALQRLVGALRHAIRGDTLIPQKEREEFMTAAQAAVERMEARIEKRGLKRGLKQGVTQGLCCSIQDLWSLRFSAPLSEERVARLLALGDEERLRAALALVARADDGDTATRELDALLATP